VNGAELRIQAVQLSSDAIQRGSAMPNVSLLDIRQQLLGFCK
jgi:hypothetical protein